MKQIQKMLGIAALVLAGSLSLSCTSLLETGERQDENAVVLTATVSRDVVSKALDASGHKTFSVGDQIAVFYSQTGGVTAKAVSSPLTDTDIRNGGTTADFSVMLLGPAANGAVRLVYPAQMAAATVDATTSPAAAATINYASLASQDGTLATLQEQFDLSVYDGHITSDYKLPEEAHLSNRLAIGEFTILNYSDENITGHLSILTIQAGEKTYTITPSDAATGFGDGPLYVAMEPIADQPILFTAKIPNDLIKFVPGKTLKADNMYPVNVKMRYQRLMTSTDNYIAQDGDFVDLNGVFGSPFQIADGATVTLHNFDAAVFDSESPVIKCQGDATIILDSNTINTVTVLGFNDNPWPAIFVPSGKTLTIFGNGVLVADCHDGLGAGIGGGFDEENDNNNYNCGNIIIAGGTILAIGGTEFNTGSAGISGSAGIGGGYQSNCGNITIKGGRILAQGGNGAAGIGSAFGGKCNDITIQGGSIGGVHWSDYGFYDYGADDGAIGSNKGAGIGVNSVLGKYNSITITNGASCIKAKRGSTDADCIGGRSGASTSEIKIDGVSGPNPASTTFTHFDSSYDGTTWILTRKPDS